MLVLCLVAPGQAAQDGVTPKAAIDKIYGEFNRAQQHLDVAAAEKWFEENLTPNFRFISPRGARIGREQLEVGVEQMLSSMSKVSESSSHIDSITVEGSTATLFVQHSFWGMVRLGMLLHPISQSRLTVETWVLTGGVWKLQRAEAHKVRATLDGRTL